ncbi:MAG: hypothetical protein EBV83_10130 [Verrucomicrobia bacterium]|nr:hypothetical protein [Verrucomicrobiota bacterium]
MEGLKTILSGVGKFLLDTIVGIWNNIKRAVGNLGIWDGIKFGLVATNVGIFEFPEAAKPVFVLSLLQLTVAVPGFTVQTVAGTFAPSQ